MLRDQNLIPLSRQHQHALALCVRMDRASPISESEAAAWRAEMTQHFRSEIRVHFRAEEQVLFPAARRFSELSPLLDELLAEHSSLRADFAAAEASDLPASELPAFAARLSLHIRKEERQLFERMQQLLGTEELTALGKQLDAILSEAVQACGLPSDKRADSTK